MPVSVCPSRPEPARQPEHVCSGRCLKHQPHGPSFCNSARISHQRISRHQQASAHQHQRNEHRDPRFSEAAKVPSVRACQGLSEPVRVRTRSSVRSNHLCDHQQRADSCMRVCTTRYVHTGRSSGRVGMSSSVSNILTAPAKENVQVQPWDRRGSSTIDPRSMHWWAQAAGALGSLCEYIQ